MGSETNRYEHWLRGFFIAKRAEGCSPKTLDDYRNGLRYLERWDHAADPSKLTSRDLKSFLANLREQITGRAEPLSSKTIYNAWVALRSFYRWLAEETSSANIAKDVPSPKTAQPVIEPLSREQLQAVLRACEHMRPALRPSADALLSRDAARRCGTRLLCSSWSMPTYASASCAPCW